jgi:hypothetical protein
MPTVTTNYILDPSGTWTVGANIESLGGAAIGTEASPAHVGGESMECITPGGGADQGIRFRTATGLGLTGAATSFMGSAYVIGAGTLYIQTTVIYTDVSFVSATRTDFAATGSWVRHVAGALVLNPAKTVDFIVVDVRTQTDQAVTYNVDAVQLEIGAAATDYFDGDSVDTATNVYAWTGTPNQSTSTRTFTPPSATKIIMPLSARRHRR